MKNGIILGVLFIAVFIAGFFMGRFTSVGSFAQVAPQQSQQSATAPKTASSPTATSSTSTQVPASSLTDGQKSMLRAMGIDPNNFTITPAMVACANAKLGAARVEEIKNGATPSFTEGISLVACYR